MKNFTYTLPVEIFFGQDQIQVLAEQIKKYGQRVLVVYSGGSIKRIGLYDQLAQIMTSNGIEFWDLAGVEPNPRSTTVNRGVSLCKEHDIEFVLAVGGGSVIDCSKAIATCIGYEGDCWDIVLDNSKVTTTLPLGVVLTLGATGSELNKLAVITNWETNQKFVIRHDGAYPKFAIMDPTYTFSVSAYQTASGIADIISHAMEVYFTQGDHAYLTNRLEEAVIRTCVHYAPIVLKEPENYEARSNIMWAASLAINDILRSAGKNCAWTVHPIEHGLSAFYDIMHGVGLAILTPYWMQYVLNEDTVDYFVDFAVNVWDVPLEKDKFAVAQAGIAKLQEFFVGIGLPARLREVGIPEDMLATIAQTVIIGDKIEGFTTIDSGDVLKIYQMAY